MKKRTTSRHYTIGYIIDSIATPYHAELLLGVKLCLERHGCHLNVLVTGQIESKYRWDNNKNTLYSMINSSVLDGLILSSASISNSIKREDFFDFLNALPLLPTVSIGVDIPGKPSVLIDNRVGMVELMEHLIGTHQIKKPVFISGYRNNQDAQARLSAFLESCEKAKIQVPDERLYYGDFQVQSGREAIAEFIDTRKLLFDSVLCANDEMASGALEELNNRGVFPPKDIVIAGFDNAEISKISNLTTVGQPVLKQAWDTCESLLSLLDNKPVQDTIVIPADLIVRNTCGCFNARAQIVLDQNKKPKPDEGLIADTFQPIQTWDSLIKDDQDLLALAEQCDRALAQSVYFDNPEPFISLWSQHLSTSKLLEIQIVAFDTILSNLKQMRVKQEKRLKAGNILNQARLILETARFNRDSFQKNLSEFQSETIAEFGENLVLKTSIPEIIQELGPQLLHIGIKNCFISLYDDPAEPLKSCHLVFGMLDSKTLPIPPVGIRYSTENLLPSQYLKELGSRNMMIQALFSGEHQTGILLMSMDYRAPRLYDLVRNKISLAFHNAKLFQRIQTHASQLEQEVETRTRDLVRTNKRLLREAEQNRRLTMKLESAMTRLAESNQRLHEISMQDSLTGLYNRRGFDTMAEQYYYHAIRNQHNFYLLFGDLDGLKAINDNYGHESGDFAIATAAWILKETFRKSDVVGRFGGDEFVILAQADKPEYLEQIRDRINENTEKANHTAQKPYRVSLSLGCAYFVYDRDNVMPTDTVLKDLMKEADENLYRLKALRKQSASQ